jgi:hypothetical protein
MAEAEQGFTRSTQDRVLVFAITLIGGPVLAFLAISGTPLGFLGISFDNTLGRALIVANSVLLVTFGLHMARHVLRGDPDILLTGRGIDFYRFPRTRHVAWSEITGIELTETSYGLGTTVPNMRLQTASGARSVSVKVQDVSPEEVVAVTAQRWADAVGLRDP